MGWSWTAGRVIAHVLCYAEVKRHGGCSLEVDSLEPGTQGVPSGQDAPAAQYGCLEIETCEG